MPIPGQSPLINIAQAKEQTITYQPLALITIAMVDGTFRYFASENLDATEGGFPYKGHNYRPRIMTESLGALQSVSDTGFVQMPTISIKLSDADKEIWINDECPPGPGYNGAKMTLTFVFWDPDTNTFSNDQMIKFVGICNPPNAAHDSITVSAVNIINLANLNLPTAQISQTCIWSFPPDHPSRVQAATNNLSVWWQCHYSVDVTDVDVAGGTAAARGNNDPTTGKPFTQCDYTRAGCIARMGNVGLPKSTPGNSFVTGQYVQIEKDLAGRRTGTFGGITFNPVYDWRGREYVSGNVNQNINDPNDAKYSGYFPQQWGGGFSTPPVMNVEGDPNSTKFECVLFAGTFVGINNGDFSTPGPIALVVVNDFVVPFRAQSQDPTILGWSWLNDGSVFGLCNRDSLFNGLGDPYGSMVALSIVIPIEVQASNAIPTVQIIWDGPAIQTFQSPTEFTLEQTPDPVWAIYNMLTIYAGLDNSSIDIDSFINASQVCDGAVTYTDLTGNTMATHQRYRLGFNLARRRSMLDVVNNLLAGFKAQLAQSAGIDPTTSGMLQLFIKQTLADQQPQPVYGSNYNLPYPSATADANSNENNVPILNSQGYFAYLFDETNILRSGDKDSPTTFTIEQRSIQDTPDKIGITFQDENYQYTSDSLTIVDTQKLSRTGQIINGPVSAEGIVNYDQAQRAIQTQFAEQFRGNPRSGTSSINGVPQDDAGGTWIAEFETTFKAIHLRVGHIVAISFVDYGLALQPFRILAITPSMNFERIKIRAQWHEDDWYLDSYGQMPNPFLQAKLASKAARPPFGWLPNTAAPLSTDPILLPTDKTFDLAQNYTAAADGTALASLVITGCEPVNNFTALGQPPYAPVLETETSGGDVPDGYYYAAIVALDAAGNNTAPSNITMVAQLTGSGGHGSLTIPNIYWQTGTVGWKVYASTNPNNLSLQLTGSGTPSSINITSYVQAGEGLPDVNFNNLEVRLTPITHSGIIGAQINAITATTITIDAVPGVDLAGRVLSVIGRLNTSTALPVWNFEIASISGSVLTISGVTDLTALTPPPVVGDVVIVRTAPDIITDTTIGDSLFVNDTRYYFPPITIVSASNTTPIIIETNVNHELLNGDSVVVAGVKGNLGANGTYSTITVVDKTHIELTGSIGTGPYNGGGTVTEYANGMSPDAEIGNFVYIEYGTGAGQWRKIVSNTQTTVTVDNPWSITPDVTSKFIITRPNVVNTTDTGKIINNNPTTKTTITVPVQNYQGQVMWCQVFTESASGTYSVITDSPGREIYIYGGPGTAVVQYDKATFNIAVSADLVVADDVCVPYIVRRPGSPVDITALVQTPSVGADVKFDVILTKNDGSYTGTIFSGAIIDIPDGSTAVVTLMDFVTNIHFDQWDLLTVDCTQTGTTQPGQGAVIVIKFKLD